MPLRRLTSIASHVEDAEKAWGWDMLDQDRDRFLPGSLMGLRNSLEVGVEAYIS